MSSQNSLTTLYNISSSIPLLLFIISLFILHQFIIEEFSYGFIAMFLALIIQTMYLMIKDLQHTNQSNFNKYLTNISELITFGICPIIFGLIFFKGAESIFIISSLILFAIFTILWAVRNWALDMKNSVGWSISFNGLFMPIIYYIYLYHLYGSDSSVFLLYFLTVGVLGIWNYNFLSNIKDKEKYYLEEFEIQKSRIMDMVENYYDKKENLQNSKDNENLEDEEFEIDGEFEADREFIEKTFQNETKNNNDFRIENMPTESELRDTFDPSSMKIENSTKKSLQEERKKNENNSADNNKEDELDRKWD